MQTQADQQKAKSLRWRILAFVIAVILAIIVGYVYFFTSWTYRGVLLFFYYIPLICVILLMPWVYEAIKDHLPDKNDDPR